MHLKYFYIILCLFTYILSAEDVQGQHFQPYQSESAIASFWPNIITQQDYEDVLRIASMDYDERSNLPDNEKLQYRDSLSRLNLQYGGQHPLTRLASLVYERDEIVDDHLSFGTFWVAEMPSKVVDGVYLEVFWWATISYDKRREQEDQDGETHKIIEEITSGRLILPDESNSTLVYRTSERQKAIFRSFRSDNTDILRLVSITGKIDEFIEAQRMRQSLIQCSSEDLAILQQPLRPCDNHLN